MDKMTPAPEKWRDKIARDLGSNWELWHNYKTKRTFINYGGDLPFKALSRGKNKEESMDKTKESQIIKELQRLVTAVQSEINKLKSERRIKEFLPFCDRIEEGQTYFYYDTTEGVIGNADFNNDCADEARIGIGNFHETEEECERWVKRQEVDVKLRNIAKRLNRGMKIDNEDELQHKYYIAYIMKKAVYNKARLMLARVTIHFTTDIICLSDKFLEVAIQEIGEQELINHYEQYQE